MFHQHSEQGLPILTLPKAIENNRWVFYDRGYLIRDPKFAETLSPRLPEGFYILNRDVQVTTEEVIPKRTLIQLSYSKNATPIVYVGKFEGSTIVFPKAGFKFSAQILGYLDEAGFRAPTPQQARHLH
ncbi:MAG: hypothetical protein AUK47_25950 [Deltaproteobacteria bacterium CG2_30_63_29]|nr:MAG: hypothetical protein AUK47_25950 [Deltaproteobacteria bacterium CG2_30_63_29]PIV98194.1 MAG: hypothetical protein COW42_16045 [Deltaproteobacteria bacterium CG17_big_fil_post_rev_8_21_14_2_50_63_7]PJB37317.1 MAG: hypothetical protein CO108_21385 [Deltaproteobacteria bacterium CG_4_9_14_3_um_filter_63_12]